MCAHLRKAVAVIVVCCVALAAACGTEPSLQAPTSSPSAAETAPPTGHESSPAVGSTPSTPGIVGRWVILEGGLEIEFLASGQFARHYPADEHQVEYWSIEGSYRLLGDDRVVIELSDEGPTTYEYRLGEPWLMLRAPDGKVTRYYRR